MIKKFLNSICVLLTLFVICFSLIGCNTNNTSKDSPESKHICQYNIKNINAQCKVNDATCLKKAKYNYSCSCGKIGKTEFEHGTFAEHSFQNGKCIWCNKLDSNNQSSQEQNTPNNPTQTEENAKAVYMTPTGARYHFSKSCAGKNAYSSTLTNAVKLGLTGCKKCT